MSKIKGHLDGLEGGFVVGWAIAESGDENCRITVVDPNGIVVVQGRASRSRPDLSVLNLGRTSIAFRLPGVDVERPGVYRVLADGVELMNSPLVIAASKFDGSLSIVRGIAVGWVKERLPSSEAPLIQILDQHGRQVGEVRASHAQASKVEASNAAVFEIDLSADCFGRGEMKLEALANGVKFAETFCRLDTLGHVETLSVDRIAGWMFSPSAPQRPFKFDIVVNGKIVGTAVCNRSRQDVQELHPDCIAPGFDFVIPERAKPRGQILTISMRHAGLATEVFDGPYVLADRPQTVAAMRKIARLALSRTNALGKEERSVLHAMVKEYIARQREQGGYFGQTQRRESVSPYVLSPRVTIIIPIYRDVGVTRACIDSVLSLLTPRDFVLLINDRSPEPTMNIVLRDYASRKNVYLLTNAENLGFIKSINRGLSFCISGDVLLLNSDTVMFAGGLDELARIAHASPDIGTVTAISSNATIFSYPHPKLRRDLLNDISWERLAEIAHSENSGLAIDVPTGHGFCLYVKRDVLLSVGQLNEAFGLGYGEENDFCARAADLGYRHVAAPGALVQHRESVSFTKDKTALLSENVARLERMYPEYTPLIMQAEEADELRIGRWKLDIARLTHTRGTGVEYVLIVCHCLGGGTKRAINDIEQHVGYAGRRRMLLECRDDGFMELLIEDPLIRAVFSPHDTVMIYKMLDAAELSLVIVHQFLGFPASFIERFGEWTLPIHSVFYAHDFYALCPRVTMIDAIGEFCNVAETTVCERCIEIGQVHPASRLTDMTPADHRELFGKLLHSFTNVVTPSENTATYLRRIYSTVDMTPIPHPEIDAVWPDQVKVNANEVILLGAIGLHKGSAKLLEIARRAKLTHPKLTFRVLGFTDIDKDLREIGNVIITGRYDKADLYRLTAKASGCLALFLSQWPETYSYTLSEAIRHGYLPLVPDIGAPAERVRTLGYGAVFPFPFSAPIVLQALDSVISDPSSFASRANLSQASMSNAESVIMTRTAYAREQSATM